MSKKVDHSKPTANTTNPDISADTQDLDLALLTEADLEEDFDLADLESDEESDEDFEDAEENDSDDGAEDADHADDEELEATEGEVTFASFDLPPTLAQTLVDIGYKTPTPVQAQAIPFAMQGRDVLATAQTGTGKTAAFAIPLLNAMLKGNRAPALILSPTRELAEQTAKVLQQLTQRTPQLRTVVIIGGSSYQYQTRGLKSKPAFVVGTPGRLIDQMGMGNLKLSTFGALVLDEADRMLDMGFAPQLEQLVSQMPADRHTMLFSATLPKEIQSMAARYLKNPERVSIGDATTPVDRIKQEVIEVDNKAKGDRLLSEIDQVEGSLIIFVRTKTRVEQVLKLLVGAGHRVARIHGDRSQRQRGDAIRDFREGHVRILVATDIAARGIDIPHIKYVVNFDLPLCPEDYIHRIGRTARAGAEGVAWAFVTPEENMLWARIYKMMYGKYPEGWDRRRQGGRSASGPRAGGGRFGNSRGGGRDGGRFGAPSRGGGNPYGQRSNDRFGGERPAARSFGRRDEDIVATHHVSARPSSAPVPRGPAAVGASSTGPSTRPAVASAPRSVAAPSAAPRAPREGAFATSAERQPVAPVARKERSSFVKDVIESFEKRQEPAEKPSASFAADILNEAESSNKRSEAPAGMNRAARRASLFSDKHREAKAKESRRNEDSEMRSEPAEARPRKTFGGDSERSAPRADRPSRPAFGGGARGGFGGPSNSDRRPSSRPSSAGPRAFGNSERRDNGGGFGRRDDRAPADHGRPSRPAFGGGSERRENGGGFGGRRDGDRPFRPAFGGGERSQGPSSGGSRGGFGGGEKRSFNRSEGSARPFAPRGGGEGASRPGKRFDRPARTEESGGGERPPSKRGRFAERLSEMLGR